MPIEAASPRAPAHGFTFSDLLPGLPSMVGEGFARPRLPSQYSQLWNHHSLPVNDTLPQGLRTYVEQSRAGLEQAPKTANPCGIAPPITMFPRRMTPGPQEAAGLVHPSPLIGSCRTRHQPWWFTMLVRLQKGQRTPTLGTD